MNGYVKRMILLKWVYLHMPLNNGDLIFLEPQYEKGELGLNKIRNFI